MTVYSLPIEIMEMVPEHVPAIDPLTSFGHNEEILHPFYRHNIFGTLAATSIRLRAIFLERSLETKVLVAGIPAFAELLVQPEMSQTFAPHVG